MAEQLESVTAPTGSSAAKTEPLSPIPGSADQALVSVTSPQVPTVGEPFHPIAAYRDKFAPHFGQQVNQLFQTMVTDSGVDVDANEVLNLRINKLAGELAVRKKLLGQLRAKQVLSIIGAVLAGVSPFIVNAIVQNQGQYLLPIGWVISIASAVGLTGLGVWGALRFTEQIRPVKQQQDDDTAQKQQYISEAKAGLAPLANQYHWNMLDPLTAQTLPGLQLDTYVPNSREYDLNSNYQLNTARPDSLDSSVISAQSGSYNGNPFLLLQTLNYAMGSKTYTGTLVISWVEMETYTDSNGRIRTRPVTRTQTLVAQVVKPFPTYWPDAEIIMGSEATPELWFSREPSKLSALEGKSAERKINRAVKKLEKQARNADAGNNFTVTANQDFDALFHAINRNDEVQFRVLFTPAAQQQMVELLREKQFGYGDNFEFHKLGKTIIVKPQHLVGNDVTGVPIPAAGSSEEWNLAHQQAGFTQRANGQFRDQYHALAPLLAIPLLHEPRESSPPEPSNLPAIWEAEANANYRGGEFVHLESVTDNILKAQRVGNDPNAFQITAYGFRGVDRLDFVPTLGGDGRIHAVPVPWVEYQPVQRTRTLHLWDAAQSQPTSASGVAPGNQTIRRGLTSSIPFGAS